jgi:hypothetical protein
LLVWADRGKFHRGVLIWLAMSAKNGKNIDELLFSGTFFFAMKEKLYYMIAGYINTS